MGLRYPEVAPANYRSPLMIGTLLNAARGAAADQQIVYRDQFSLRYRDLCDRIGRLASVLAGGGAEEGVTVAVMDWDSHRYLEAFFAVPMMGAVLQTVNVRLSREQILFTLRDAGVSLLIVHRDFVPLVEQMRHDLPALRTIILIEDDDEAPKAASFDGSYETLLARAAPDYDFRDFDENALATTFYTSGTTGDPKGVSFTHRQIVLHSLALASALATAPADHRLASDDVYMPLTPMFHVHAWGLPYIATMLGLKQVYPGRYEPDLICRLREAHQVSFSHCVPTVLQMLLPAAEAAKVDLAGWKMVIGGSALTRTLFQEGSLRGVRLAAGYGMSETCPAISLARPNALDRDGEGEAEALTSAGLAIPLVSVEIVDTAMQPKPHDGHARGELVLRAPWLTAGYSGAPEASEALWRGGWLHTQDLASIDQGGRIRIRDRLKDVIKTGGEWIDSQQLEDLLSAVDGVAAVAVIGVPDEKWGERPLAVIVPSGDAVPTLAQLNAPILAAISAGALTRYARLDAVTFVSELPITTVGKIDKRRLHQAIP